MSMKNRKMTFDKLMAAGREKDVSAMLMAEFGKKEEPKKEDPKLVKLKVKKTEVKKDGN
jgi:hypothetical protein